MGQQYVLSDNVLGIKARAWNCSIVVAMMETVIEHFNVHDTIPTLHHPLSMFMYVY